MLDRNRIKSELLRRGMTLGTWAKARDIEYSALTRVLYGTAGEEYTRKIRAALKKDGLLFETGTSAAKDTTQGVFWTFPAASKYLGVSEKKLRSWEKNGTSNFPRAIRVGVCMLLSSEAVKRWANGVLAQHGF